MKTDTEIRTKGVEVLMHELGALDAERFFALILKEPFDYTQWQKELWTEKTIEQISGEAMVHRKRNAKRTRRI